MVSGGRDHWLTRQAPRLATDVSNSSPSIIRQALSRGSCSLDSLSRECQYDQSSFKTTLDCLMEI